MTIDFEDIFSKCQDLSSFEGARITDGSGNTLYDVIHIDEQDDQFIFNFALDACSVLCSSFRNVIESTTTDATRFTITFINDSSLSLDSASFEKHINECVVAYVMERWLENKSKERSDAYMAIYTQMLSSAIRRVCRNRPTLNANY